MPIKKQQNNFLQVCTCLNSSTMKQICPIHAPLPESITTTTAIGWNHRNDWEKEFDEKFCIKANLPRWIFGTHLKKDLNDKDIKYFIRTQIQNAYERGSAERGGFESEQKK